MKMFTKSDCTLCADSICDECDSLNVVKTHEKWLEDVQFMDYIFLVRESHGGMFLQARYTEADTYSGQPESQLTRKWLLSPYMTKSEVVQTAFKCCLTSMEHRAREAFKYKGRRVFGPHFNVDDLFGLCADRENAGGRE